MGYVGQSLHPPRATNDLLSSALMDGGVGVGGGEGSGRPRYAAAAVCVVECPHGMGMTR